MGFVMTKSIKAKLTQGIINALIIKSSRSQIKQTLGFYVLYYSSLPKKFLKKEIWIIKICMSERPRKIIIKLLSFHYCA